MKNSLSAFSKLSKPRLGLLVGFAAGMIISWGSYLTTQISIILGGPALYNTAVRQWEWISMPAFLCAELFGLHIYKSETHEFTVAGIFLITLVNAFLFSAAGGIVACLWQRQRMSEKHAEQAKPENARWGKSRRSSIVNALLKGFAFGVLLTLIIYLPIVLSHREHYTLLASLLGYAWLLLLLPTLMLVAALGLDRSIVHLPHMVILIVIINGICCGFVASFFRWLINAFTKHTHNNH